MDDFRLICPYCGAPVDLDSYTGIVNSGLPDKHIPCTRCFTHMLIKEQLCMCFNCYEYVTVDNLLFNPATGKNEICPLCNKVWHKQGGRK